MNILDAVILGAVQGLTEFLPVSSSGHLVIFQELLGFDGPRVMFSVLLHLATSAAVLVYFREKLFKLDRRMIILIGIGSVPAVIAGLLIEPFVEIFFESVRIVGIALLVTSLLTYLTDKPFARRSKINLIDSLMIGVAQAFAIVPGISRSGSTIFAGTASGIDRKTVAEYSFLLSVPVIIGASAYELLKHGASVNEDLLPIAAGAFTAFAVGMIAISIVLRLLTEKRFKFFSAYTLILGVVAIFLG